MSILIRGMEMPKSRPVCIVIDAAGQARRYDLNNDRYADDKLFEAVPVQEHGRLIDAAALWVEINKICDRRDAGIITDLTCLQQLLSAVRHAPTVIEAEEGKRDRH